MILASVAASIVVTLAACFLFARHWRRRMHRGLETEALMRRLRGELAELITEMNGTTERNVALLETRIHALGSLVERAGKVERVLERETEKSENLHRVYSELGRNRGLNITLEEETKLDPAVEFDLLPIREKALVLHRRGEGLDRIADTLSMSRGEVELIISLHDRRA